MYRYWHGAIVGRTVSHVWEGYASVLFIEFGALRQAGYMRRDGNPGEPEGEFELTTMESYADWNLMLKDTLLATAEKIRTRRTRALRWLIGRRLFTFEIDPISRSTRLTFGHGIVLHTATRCRQLHSSPHWMLRSPTSGSDNWASIVLPRTANACSAAGRVGNPA